MIDERKKYIESLEKEELESVEYEIAYQLKRIADNLEKNYKLNKLKRYC